MRTRSIPLRDLLPDRPSHRAASLVACSALVLAGSVLGACQPAVSLKAPQRFTVATAKAYGWEDRCGLQGFFDGNPPANDLVSEQGTNVHLAGLKGQERGRAVHRISDPRQRHMLGRLLQRFYRAAPALAASGPVEVEVGYYRFCGKARALVGGAIRLRAGGREITLAYHPCLGEYLLNADLYAFRRKLMAEGELQVARNRSR